MSQASALVAALKSVLKARAITYAKLAKGLGISEASVKRTFSEETFSLRRFDQICNWLGIEISDLAKMLEHDAERAVQLTREQEEAIVSDPKLLLVAVYALNHWSFEEMLDAYSFGRPELIRLLSRLDRLGIIELLPNNRIRVRLARNFAWLANGPIQEYFRTQIQKDFFRSAFDADGEALMFVSGMLSRTSNAAIRSQIRRLGAEFSELHGRDITLPLSEREGTSLLLAIRPWTPQSFAQMRRAETTRHKRR